MHHILFLFGLFLFPGLNDDSTAHPASAVEDIRIIARGEWAEHPPLGRDADAARRNLGVGDTLEFGDLRLGVQAVTARIGNGNKNRAEIILGSQDVRETRTMAEGSTLNWHDYQIGVLSINADVLGGGWVELEVERVATMPVARRSQWRTGGAEDRLRIRHEIDTITLHHTGSPDPLTPDIDPVEWLRGLQRWGASARSWWDVPYHYLIDLDGIIYEGRDHRYMGETNTSYDPRGHLLISVMGNYNLQEPTPAQLIAVAKMMAWAIDAFDVPLERISGHDEWADTVCPGRHLRSHLEDGSLVDAVRDYLSRTHGK